MIKYLGWGFLLLIVVNLLGADLAISQESRQQEQQFQQLLPCTSKLTKLTIYPLVFPNSKSISKYFVAYSTRPKQDSCVQSNLDLVIRSSLVQDTSYPTSGAADLGIKRSIPCRTTVCR